MQRIARGLHGLMRGGWTAAQRDERSPAKTRSRRRWPSAVDLAGDRRGGVHRLEPGRGLAARTARTVVGLDNFSTGHQRNLDEAAGGGAGRGRPLPHDRRRHPRPRGVRGGGRGGRRRAPPGGAGIGAALDRRSARPATTATSPASSTCSMPRGGRGSSGSSMPRPVSTYGDEPNLPKREERIGNPLSPYAATKLIDEIYAAVYAPQLRLQGDRPALFQRVRAAPGPRRRLCGGDPQMDRGDARATSR